MTSKSQQQIRYTLTTHSIEKLIPSKHALRLCAQVSAGAIDADTAVTALLRAYGLKRHG